MGLSNSAKVLLHQAWLYAGQHETNGHVPDCARRLIGYTSRAYRELTEAAWWARNGDGWELHDWLDWQVDAEEVRQKRETLRQQWRDSKRRLRAVDDSSGPTNVQ